MTAQTFSLSAKSKIRFFLVYGVSVILFVIIALSVFKQGGTENNIVNETTNVQQEDDLVKEERLALQNKLDVLRKTHLANSNNLVTSAKPAAVQEAENDVQKTLDEWREKASSQTNPQLQETMQTTLNTFETELDQQRQLYNVVLQTKKEGQSLAVKSNDEELQQLRNLVAEKEKQIASLQTDLSQKPVAASQTGPDESRQWKERAASLKATNDKLSKQISTMTASYKIIVEDNQRLLTRLQENRKN